MRALILAIVCLSASLTFASGASTDSSEVTIADLEKMIDVGAAMLRGKAPITTEDAIMLVRLSNTLYLSERELTKKDKDFLALMWGQELVERLKAALGEAVINKGMGYYFPKHDLHWGGAGGNIRDRDRYVITDKKK